MGADLASLCKEASLFCLRRCHKLKNSCRRSFCKKIVNSAVSFEGNLENSNSVRCRRDLHQNNSYYGYCCSEIISDNDEVIQSASYIGNGGTVNGDFMLKIVLEDFEKAKMKVSPSAMREVSFYAHHLSTLGCWSPFLNIQCSLLAIIIHWLIIVYAFSSLYVVYSRT